MCVCVCRLTAFVVKSYGGARPYIFVDPEQITLAKTWLHQKQKENGCFQSVGRLLNNGMKVGVQESYM